MPIPMVMPMVMPMPPILTGVSAGAIIAAAISTGVTPEDAMNVVLNVSERTVDKGGRVMDALMPGFSLIDELEAPLLAEMVKALGGSVDSTAVGDDDYDVELLQNRIMDGRLLRIGLADRRRMDFTKVERDLTSYVYVDQYRDLRDILSAAILSSFVPIGTGPVKGEKDAHNLAVSRAWDNIQDMEARGFIKHGITHMPTNAANINIIGADDNNKQNQQTEQQSHKLHYIDGGLVNMFPQIDASTLIVSPCNGTYVHPYIAPQHTPSAFRQTLERYTERSSILPTVTASSSTLKIDERVSLGINSQNLEAAYRMAHSSGTDVLEEKFRDGYDDTHRFLKEQDLLTVFRG